MQKEAFYFPHFSNARHDRKIRRLRKELGIEGYGIYFMLLETLRDQHDMMYPLADCDLLAEEFGTSDAKIKTVLCNYELFDFDEESRFFSPKMLVYLEPYFKMKEQRVLAGKASAVKRMLNDRSTTVQQSKVKESKVNEIKVKESKLEFSEILSPHASLFTYTEYEKFYNYWTEKNAKGKERWEMEKFFDIKRRIATWLGNASKYEPIKPKQELSKLQQNMVSLKNVHDQLTEEIQNGTFINPYK
jgi:hypothetical protein